MNIEPSLEADNLKKTLNNIYGNRSFIDDERERLMDAVFSEIGMAGADHLSRHHMEYYGENDGHADAILACFVEGEAIEWVAFVLYDTAWANAIRPFTNDTKDMAWLENFITERKKELVG